MTDWHRPHADLPSVGPTKPAFWDRVEAALDTHFMNALLVLFITLLAGFGVGLAVMS